MGARSEPKEVRRGLVARLSGFGVAALLTVWACPLLVVTSLLMGSHWVGLPAPSPADRALQQALAQLDDPARGRWQLLHVLYGECRCSQRILDHLTQRGLLDGVVERVLLVAGESSQESRAREHGLLVTRVTPEELQARFHLTSAPLLIVVDPTGVVRYVGGYTRQPQGLDYQELRILTDLREQRPSPPLPTFGCAVSRELQSQLDPLGIKYLR